MQGLWQEVLARVRLSNPDTDNRRDVYVYGHVFEGVAGMTVTAAMIDEAFGAGPRKVKPFTALYPWWRVKSVTRLSQLPVERGDDVADTVQAQ